MQYISVNYYRDDFIVPFYVIILIIDYKSSGHATEESGIF